MINMEWALFIEPHVNPRGLGPSSGGGSPGAGFSGEAPWPAQHWNHVIYGLFETLSPPLPGPPHPILAESQSWAGELGAHSFPMSSFGSWRSLSCAPGWTEHFLVIEAGVWWASSVSVSCPFLAFTTLDRQKRTPKTFGTWQVHPQGQREGCSAQRKCTVGAGGSASPVETSTAQSSQGRAPGGGGLGAQPGGRTHRIWRSKRGQAVFAGLL